MRWSLSLLALHFRLIQRRLCTRHRRNIARAGGQGGTNVSQIFFLPRNSSYGYWVEEGQINNWGDSGGKRGLCVYYGMDLNNLPLFLTCLLRKLKFLIPMVNFAPLPPSPTKLRLCPWENTRGGKHELDKHVHLRASILGSHCVCARALAVEILPVLMVCVSCLTASRTARS
jgi:hypothetical protein